MDEFDVCGRNTASPKIVMKFEVHNGQRRRGRQELVRGSALEHDGPNLDRIPKITKLMALAIHLQKLVDEGVVRDYAEIARFAGLTRARVSQIMNLNLLAPGIQEKILLMPRISQGVDPISERRVRDIAIKTRWDRQIKQWQVLTRDCESTDFDDVCNNAHNGKSGG